jgi:hypothetical protein
MVCRTLLFVLLLDRFALYLDSHARRTVHESLGLQLYLVSFSETCSMSVCEKKVEYKEGENVLEGFLAVPR